jgi:predicted DNA-binding protein (UPF0251 family)
MSRPFKCRYIGYLPKVTIFKPAGIPMRELEEVSFSFDETEAIRLKDLEGLEQEPAAEQMNISRSTFQRILASAHWKLADMILNGKAMQIAGGTFNIIGKKHRSWFKPDLEINCHQLAKLTDQREGGIERWRNVSFYADNAGIFSACHIIVVRYIIEKLIALNAAVRILLKLLPGRRWDPALIYLRIPSGNMNVRSAIRGLKCPYLKALPRKKPENASTAVPGMSTG